MRAARHAVYAVIRALAAMRRAPWATLQAIAAIALAFGFLGLAHVAARNLDSITGRMAGAHMIVYLDDGVSDEHARAIAQALARLPAVEQQTYIDQRQAYERLQATLGAMAEHSELASDAMKGIDVTMLPASIEVVLADGVRDVAMLEPVVRRLEAVPGVESVEVTGDWIDRVTAFHGGVSKIGWIVTAFLAGACLCLVVAIMTARSRSRRFEATVLDMLGASRFFVRGPLVIEGVVQGLAGAALAALGLWLLFTWSAPSVSRILSHVLDRAEALVFLPPAQIALFVAAGGLLGLCGALWATRHHAMA